jgi:hypothetical protein
MALSQYVFAQDAVYWIFPSAATRLAEPVTSAHNLKLAYQTDTGEFWLFVAPSTWRKVYLYDSPVAWAARQVAGSPIVQTISDYGVNLQVKYDGVSRNLPNGPQILYHNGADQVAGAVTTEVVLATITVPDKLLGLSSSLRLRLHGSQTNNVNNKTWKVKWDGAASAVLAINSVVTAQDDFVAEVLIQNKNSISAQKILGLVNGVLSVSTVGAKNTDTSVTTILITGQKAVSTDTMTLGFVTLEAFP